MKKQPVLFGGFEQGKTYFSDYWRQFYKVLELHGKGDWTDWSVTVMWADGRIKNHRTPLGKRDKVVS